LVAQPGLISFELELINASAKGDAEAFNRLVLAYQLQVYNVAYRMLSNREDAADATQDAFVSAFRNIHTFRGGSFKAWLLKIATNACYDRLRSRKRRPVVSLDSTTEEDDPHAAGRIDPPDPSIGPETLVLKREVLAQIQEGLNALPADQRLVVILSDVQGYAYEEIAEITGANLGTVKSRLSRGRTSLRDFLRRTELLPTKYRHELGNRE